MKKNRVVIGVGGNIGSGKTTAAKIFQSYGMKYISADQIGWSVLPEIAGKLRNRFGDAIFSGSKIDRTKLRNLVFSNPKYLKTLNSISHPRLLKKIHKEMDNSRSKSIVIDAALLFSWPDLLRKIDCPILVKSNKILKRKRALRKGITREIFEKILNTQQTESEMAQKAKYIIKNNGTLLQLERQCRKIFKELKNDC
ncbi:MAG: dephospho-CoA kinase [candidate division WOR-3 bacterium]